MPLRNGTGPLGSGPRSGRGNGWCRTGSVYRGSTRALPPGRHGWLAGIIVPLAAAILRDMLNPAGLLRGSMRLLSHAKRTNTVQPGRREAEYTVLENREVGAVTKDSMHQSDAEAS